VRSRKFGQAVRRAAGDVAGHAAVVDIVLPLR